MVDVVYGGTIVVGIIVLCRVAIYRKPLLLAKWPISSSEFILLASWTLMGAYTMPQFGLAGIRLFGVVNADVDALIQQVFFDLGILAGVGCGMAYLRRVIVVSVAKKDRTVGHWTAGMITFLASVPLTVGIAKIWEWVLMLLGLPVERQRQFDILGGIRSPTLLAAWSVVSVILAPVAEELMFRAGLFRYLRERVPRWLSLAIPSTIFASLHIDWKSSKGLAAFAPLVVLGLIWSIAYERTGSILVSVVAHCLTNFTTLAFFAISR